MKRKIEIDFLYLDNEVCARCRGTEANLEAALEEVSGADVVLRKTLVESEEQAIRLGLASSPTIRVNGRDLAPELRESRCEPCGGVDCRVWVWKGREYTEAPKAMIVEAILREAAFELPENLRKFFAAGKACCSPEERASCCDSSAQAACCGTAESRCSC